MIEDVPPFAGDHAGAGPPPLVFTRRLIQGVECFHAQTAPGGNLFLTRFGLPFAAHLHPDNWQASAWFASHRRRLRGTSTIYHTETQPVRGRSLELLVR
jgi:hypothetical protein